MEKHSKITDRKEEPRWYALYTKSRNEKKVVARLTDRGYECYLPLQKTLRKWSDRKKLVEVPLINSYVFVRIVLSQRFDVLQDPGAVFFINFERLPAPVADRDIEYLKRILGEGYEVEAVQEAIEVGEKVKVVVGQLMGMEGELVEHRGGQKVLVRIENIPFSLVVSIPLEFIEKVIGDR